VLTFCAPILNVSAAAIKYTGTYLPEHVLFLEPSSEMIALHALNNIKLETGSVIRFAPVFFVVVWKVN